MKAPLFLIGLSVAGAALSAPAQSTNTPPMALPPPPNLLGISNVTVIPTPDGQGLTISATLPTNQLARLQALAGDTNAPEVFIVSAVNRQAMQTISQARARQAQRASQSVLRQPTLQFLSNTNAP
jgi:hypothetical protein